MKHLGLTPVARLVAAALAFLLVATWLWAFVVAPLRSDRARLRTQLVEVELQLDDLERGIEAIPPSSEAERRSWRVSADALRGQLGPLSDLPLFVEAVVRLSEAQGLEARVTTSPGTATPLAGAAAGEPGSGVVQVPVSVTAHGAYDDFGRFIARLGRLGWVTEIESAGLRRWFPEVEGEIRLRVYFRAASPSDGTDSSTQEGGR